MMGSTLSGVRASADIVYSLSINDLVAIYPHIPETRLLQAPLLGLKYACNVQHTAPKVG